MPIEHTPTPWEVIDRPAPSRVDHGWRQISLPSKKMIACRAEQQFLSDWDAAQERAEANAKHIVRCVNAYDDMLEALQYLMAVIGEGTSKGRALDLIPKKATDKAYAAIEKATGEQQ